MGRNPDRLRNALCLTQDFFALLIGTSRNMLAQVETNRRSLPDEPWKTSIEIQLEWEKFSSGYQPEGTVPYSPGSKFLEKKQKRLEQVLFLITRAEHRLKRLPPLEPLFKALAFWKGYQTDVDIRVLVRKSALSAIEKEIQILTETKVELELELEAYRQEVRALRDLLDRFGPPPEKPTASATPAPPSRPLR